MTLSRRFFVAAGASVCLSNSAFSATPVDNSPFGLRSLGNSTAPITVIEYFSLTCSHCAKFMTKVMPKIKADLVSTGKVKIIYKDFPLDVVALSVAMVARSLPVDEYDPFICTMFENQKSWAQGRVADFKSDLLRYASLAGMDEETFDEAISNTELESFIMQERNHAQTTYGINATPSFIIDGRVAVGDLDYPEFARLIGLT